jgi:predicted DNA-binding transcriptional regulator AlpA
MTTVTTRLTKHEVEQAARLAMDRARVERRAASLTTHQVWLSSRQVRDRFGGRSAMWLWRRQHQDPQFPQPKRFGRLLFWSLAELEAYERGQASPAT